MGSGSVWLESKGSGQRGCQVTCVGVSGVGVSGAGVIWAGVWVGLGWDWVGVQITHMRTLTYTCVLAYKGWCQGWVCNCVIVYRFMGPACTHACV